MKFLLLALLSVMVWPSQQKILEECRDQQVDILFIIDESGSVNADRFELVKKFIRNIVRRSFVAPDQVQFSLMTFGYKEHYHFYLNTHKTVGEVLGAVDKLQKTEAEGGTYTHVALSKAKGLLFGRSYGARNGALKYVILFTDGPSKYADKTAAGAKGLRDAKVKIAAVGVDNYDYTELQAIASDPDEKFVYKTEKFEELPRLAKKVAAVTCAGYNAYGVCPAGGMDRCCPAHHVSFEGSCYFFANRLLNDFKTADKACKQMGAELVTIDSYQEDEFLVNHLKQMIKDKLPVATTYYTGYHYTGGEWTWVSKEEPEYTANRWYGSYPYSNYAAYGECMVMHKSYAPFKWMQQKCGSKSGFICES